MSVLALEILVKGTVLIGLVFAIAALLRRASASTRHLVWGCGLLGLLLLPLLTAMPWRLPVVPAFAPIAAEEIRTAGPTEAGPTAAPALPSESGVQRSADPAATAGTAAVGSTGGARVIDRASGAPASPAGSFPPGSPLSVLLAVWAAGALVVAGRYLAGAVSLRRTVARARSVEDPEWTGALRWASDRLLLDERVRLLESDEVSMPLTAGTLRPVVVLPASALEWPIDRRRAVLVHELAHVRRKDALTHALTWIAAAVWWFHPLVWIAARHLRAESERACDDLVLRAGTRPSSYADHLLEIVCSTGSRAPAPALPMAQRSEFEGRMLRILAPDARRNGLSALRGLGIGVAVLTLAVPLAAVGTVDPAPAETIVSKRSAGEDVEVAEASGPDEIPAAAVDESVEGSASAEVSLLDSIDEKTPRELLRQGARTTRSLLRLLPEDLLDPGDMDADDLADTILPSLIGALLDEDAEVRAVVARALGELDDPQAVDALARVLREDPDADVRRTAAWALGEIESPRAIPALGRALREDASREVREMAVWALGEIEDPAAVPALADAADDPDPKIRRKVAWALGEIEDPAAVPALRGLLRDEDAETRKIALWAIAEIEAPASYEVLVELLKDENPEVRKAAARALAEADVDVDTDVDTDTDVER